MDKINLFHSLRKSYIELWDLIQRIGEENYLKKSAYKQDREKWIAVGFIGGIRKYTGKEWFINMEECDPPDFKVIALDDPKDKKPFIEASVEAIEIQGNIIKDKIPEEAVASFIYHKKLDPKKKVYPSHYIICAYLNFTAINFKMNKVYEYFNKLNIANRDIWLMGNGNENLEELFIAKVWPKLSGIIEYNIKDIF